MSAAPTIQNPTPGPITGAATWRKVRSAPQFSGGQVKIHETWRGSYLELTTAYNYLVSNSPWAESITPSVSERSAIATLTKVWPQVVTWGGYQPHEVQTPQYECLGVRMTIPLKSFEPFAADILAGAAAGYLDVDAQIAAGQYNALTYSVDPIMSYMGLRIRGVTGFERVTYQLRLTRTFDARENIPDLTADYAKVSSVESWTSLRFIGDSIPSFVTEPKMVLCPTTLGSFVIVPCQWKYCEPKILYRGKGCSVVLGADADYKWSKTLYMGGMFDP
jgi:hypothetical protein